jgi:target of rapamycin complex subunit LST8
MGAMSVILCTGMSPYCEEMLFSLINVYSWLRPYNSVRLSLNTISSHSSYSCQAFLLLTDGPEPTRFWEALSGICSRTIPHPDSQVNRLCISPDKRFLAAAGHHTVKLYDVRSSNPGAILTFEGHANNVTGVAFHCEGKWMVTSSEDGTVKIWDTRTGTVQRNYSHGMPVNDVVIHPNQGELISCDRGGNVRVWDLGENKCSHQLIPEDDVSVASVSVASDGSMLCAGNNSVSLNR